MCQFYLESHLDSSQRSTGQNSPSLYKLEKGKGGGEIDVFESAPGTEIESTTQEERCFRVTLMSSTFTCFYFICLIV